MSRATLPAICEYCSRIFLARSDSGPFCSRQCAGKAKRINYNDKEEWTRPTKIIICEKCGKEHEVRADTSVRFCSHSCALSGHGLNDHPLYSIWKAIRQRCYNPNNPSAHNYSKRGITIASKWEIFMNFYNDMIDSYQPGLTLDRRNNNGPYSKDNCRWATRIEQANNTRRNCRILDNGISITLADYARKHNIPYREVWESYQASKYTTAI